MTFIYLSPVALSFLLLAAHFMHADNAVLVVAALALLALMALRRPWVKPVLQIALVLGAMEWVRTAVLLVQERLALGQPFVRLAVILGAVALLTLLASLVFLARPVRAYFGEGLTHGFDGRGEPR